MSGSSKDSTKQEKKRLRPSLVALQRRTLGYQPLRMKPVHFATSFLLCLTHEYRVLEHLNKAANPKALEKRPGDPYVTENLYNELKEHSDPFGEFVSEEDFAMLRNHLNAAFNNDGSALAAAFPPYSTIGYDFTTPSAAYLANASKNHGDSGAFVWTVLNRTEDGQRCLEFARTIFLKTALPAAVVAHPFVPDEAETFEGAPSVLTKEASEYRIGEISDMMKNQTSALRQLLENLHRDDPAYALRQMIIGVGSWLLIYLIRSSSSGDIALFSDFSSGNRARVRDQAKACYARSISRFGKAVSESVSSGRIDAAKEEEEALSLLEADSIKDMEQHFNDFALRIGWAQPRASNVKQKHFEAVPDTLKVLLTSVLKPGEVVTMDEIASRLLESWRICIGLVPSDHRLLQSQGYSPLDHDADLRTNRDAFKNLAVRLDLAREPSDGLVLFSLRPQTSF